MQYCDGVIYSIWIVEFQASKKIAAWFTVLPMFLLYFLSPLFQIIQDHIQGYQGIGFVSSLFYGTSFLASSFVINKYLLFVSYSFPMGIGLLLMTTPQTLAIPQYFQKHLSLATALATTSCFLFSMSAPPLITVIQGFSLLSFVICDTVTLLWRRKKPFEFNCENHCKTELDLNQWIVLENGNSQSEKGHKNIKIGEHGSEEYYAGHSRTYYNKDWGERKKENYNTYTNIQQKSPKYRFIVTSYIKLMSSYNFRIMLLGLMMNSVELVVSLTHIVEYAVELKIPRKLANILLTFLSEGSIIGRIVFGRVFDLNCINKVFLFKLLLSILGIIATEG